MEHVDIGAVRVGYQRAGDGPPLVLLHGAVSDRRVWRVELDAFADEYTVVAWDAPGCGGSSDLPPGGTMGDYADCLARFMEALALAPAHVVGHSWGSTLALVLALRHPAAVRSLVLVGAYAGWAGSLPPDQVATRLAFASAAADEVASGRWDPRSMPGLFSDVMPPDRADELAAIMADVRPAATRDMAAALAECDLRAELPGVDCPTLLVYGDDDARSPVSVGEAIRERIPGAQLSVLPGLGHECYVEDPPAFEAVVRSFLRTHTRDAASR